MERIIRKITDPADPADIDRLLVVTFTNAAATEMRKRIGEAITAVLEQNPGSPALQRQLSLLNKASITTIHSFCLEVIRGNFPSLKLDPGFRIADETEAALLKLEVLKELFEDTNMKVKIAKAQTVKVKTVKPKIVKPKTVKAVKAKIAKPKIVKPEKAGPGSSGITGVLWRQPG